MRKRILASATMLIASLLGAVQGNAIGSGLQPSGITVGGAPLSVLQQTTTVSSPLILGGSTNPGTLSPFGTLTPISMTMGASALLAPSNLGSSSYTVNPGNFVNPPTPLASISVSQMMPPAPVNYVPPTTVKKTAMAMKLSMVAQPTVISGPTGGDVTSGITPPVTDQSIVGASASSYEIAGERPDFSYNSGRLEFKEQPTHTTGQNGMGVGPGLPQGTSRYVPVGEF